MALEGALKFFPGIKIEPEQELCFQGLVVLKERCTQSMEKPHIPASAETMSESRGGDSDMKQTGTLVRNFEFNP